MRKIILLLIVALLGACHTNQKKQNEQTAGHVKSISLENGNMVVTFEACPDSSIDMQAWKEHYNKYPERWEVAFDYLSGIDPDSLPLGRTDLSDEVFVAVSEYTTKEPADVRYEAHRQYIDLQYVASGSEYIGIQRDTTQLTCVQPYTESNDVAFYTGEGELMKATPDRFFIFFPKDAHRPCLKDSEPALLKKIVVKIKAD